jgi:hypothetical protein
MGAVEMQLALILVTAIIQAATLYFVYSLVQELARIRTMLDRWSSRPVEIIEEKPYTSSHKHIIIKYAIWVWRGDSWELDLASVPAGSEAGAPPSFRGAFEGHRVKQELAR